MEKKITSIRQSIGLLDGVAFVVGGIIGTGIFVSPAGVLVDIESVGGALVIWLCCAIFAFLGALCYAELGSTFPQSGGDYSYIRTIFGDLPAFLYLWICICVLFPSGIAIGSLVFAKYVLTLFFSCGAVNEYVLRIVAAMLLCLLTYINCQNVKWTTRVQGIFTSAKVFALLVIIIAGLYYISLGHTKNFENAFQGTTSKPDNFVLAFFSGLYAFSGWNIVNCITEEVKDPQKNLLKIVYISMPLVTVIYILANVAYFAVLTPEEILSSNAVAVTFGDAVMFCMGSIMSISVAISTFGKLIGANFSFSRIYYVASREGQLPFIFSTIHVYKCSAVPSLIFMCLTTFCFLSTTEVYSLIHYASFIEAATSSLTILGMLWMRYKKPYLKRPVKVHVLVPVIYFVICLVMTVITIYENFLSTIIGISIMLAGIPVYAVTVNWENKPDIYYKVAGGITVFLQKLMFCVPAEKLELETLID